MKAGRRSKAVGLDDLSGATVAVWGVGIEGSAIAELALERGARLTLLDDRASGSALSIAGHEVPVLPPSVIIPGRFEYVVRSPGVSRYRPELVAVAGSGTTVTTATALWMRDFSDEAVIGVTGSKGKSTTVSFATALLRARGLRVGMGGNIGKPVTDFYDEPKCDAYVVEISSFQAAEVESSPRVGVLTLLSPDHLDWHGTYERYVADKVNLFAHRAEISLAVNGLSAEALSATASYRDRLVYGAASGRAVFDGDRVILDGEPWASADELSAAEAPAAEEQMGGARIRGAHNFVNLCGALSAVLLLGEPVADPAGFVAALSEMPPLRSRLQTVCVHDGVEFVDDALASNPSATIAALRSFAGRPVCLIVGGYDRGVDIADLSDELAAMEPEPALVSVGAVGERVSDGLGERKPGFRSARASRMDEAVRLSASLVGKGGVVLFSPASPTPREEGSYVQRSDAFVAAVSGLFGDEPCGR